VVNDSQSETSALSEADHDADADADDSDLSGTDAPGSSTVASQRHTHRRNGPSTGKRAEKKNSTSPGAARPSAGPSFTVIGDTDAMINGMQPAGKPSGESEALDFEATGDQASVQPVVVRTEGQQNENRRQETPVDRRRREHDDYKKKRDSDPAFVPTRGNFFMHDTVRAAGGQQNGFRPFPGRGRGRGRNGVGGPYSPATYVHRCLLARTNGRTWLTT
jgi:CASC3/Barentsz eIF4AIII binding